MGAMRGAVPSIDVQKPGFSKKPGFFGVRSHTDAGICLTRPRRPAENAPGSRAEAESMSQPEAERTEPEQAGDRTPGSPSAAGRNIAAADAVARAAPPRRRRWYQFSLWTLFALTLLAAVLLMGWRWMIAPYRTQADTMALVERLGGSYQSQPASKWMSRLAGQGLGDLTLVNLADCDQPDEYVAAVARLPRLEILVVGGQAFGDEQIAQLSGTKSLRWLILDSTSVSAEALAAVQDANPDLQVYRSQRRTIAAIKAAGGDLNRKINARYRDLHGFVGTDFFDEPDFLAAFQPVDVVLVSRLASLTTASLGDAPIADADLVEIAKTPNLQSLYFNSPHITDLGVQHVSGMTPLRNLGLLGSSITDVALASLADKRELTGLHLGGTKITDAGLAHLAHLTNLEKLTLESTLVSDEGLAYLGAMTKLKMLRVPWTKVGDAGLAHLAKHDAMEELEFSETQVTDMGLKSVAGMTRLKELGIGKTSISDQGLAHLKDLQNLKQLWMGGTKITDAGLVHLRGMAKLQRLHLEDTQITDAAVNELAKLASLTELDVTNTRMTNEGWAKLQKALPGCQISLGVRKPQKP